MSRSARPLLLDERPGTSGSDRSTGSRSRVQRIPVPQVEPVREPAAANAEDNLDAGESYLTRKDSTLSFEQVPASPVRLDDEPCGQSKSDTGRVA
eukprot:819264-Rhodomonas_salina.2